MLGQIGAGLGAMGEAALGQVSDVLSAPRRFMWSFLPGSPQTGTELLSPLIDRLGLKDTGWDTALGMGAEILGDPLTYAGGIAGGLIGKNIGLAGAREAATTKLAQQTLQSNNAAKMSLADRIKAATARSQTDDMAAAASKGKTGIVPDHNHPYNHDLVYPDKMMQSDAARLAQQMREEGMQQLGGFANQARVLDDEGFRAMRLLGNTGWKSPVSPLEMALVGGAGGAGFLGGNLLQMDPRMRGR